MEKISRRDALRLGMAGAAVPAALSATSMLGATPAVAAPRDAGSDELVGTVAQRSIPIPAGWSVKPFDNNQVALHPSLFTDNRDRIHQFLLNYPIDNMLYLFRLAVGLPNPPGSSQPGGWETSDGNLRGHYAGHFLSALALGYAGSGNTAFLDRANYFVTTLAQCRDAWAAAAAQPTPRVAGKFGSAVNLTGCGKANTGNSEHLQLPAGVVDGLTDFTVAVWVNPTALTNNTAIFDFGTSNTSHMYLQANSSNHPVFGITTNGTGGLQTIAGTAQLPTGTWTHLAVTHAGNTTTLYVDGVAVNTNTGMTLSPASLGATTLNYIGRNQYPMGSVEFLNAKVSDFRVYDHALAADEVQSLTTSEGGSTGGGNVVWYRFAETNGPTATDSSGNGRDAHIFAPTDGQRHPGFLAAYPETQYIRLEQLSTYSPIWAPWYTCHMIMRGLLDAYLYTGNQQALSLVTGMADWAQSRLTKLPRTTLDSMWKIYIAGEYNAMPEVLAELAAVTGNTGYLETAECFVNTYLFDAAVANQDTINGEHANQHIPQYRSYLTIYDNFSDSVQPTYRAPAEQYLTAAKNFWDMVVPHRIYVDGGMAGSGEIFGARDVIASTIQTSNAETCCEYNMLKLSRNLFFHTADPKYMQYYERTLFGQILASRRNTSSNTNPNLTYFIPVNPGTTRGYGNLGTCCGGTGLESHEKFQDSIYFASVDDTELYVNLYIPSTLNWAARGISLDQATNFPTDPTGETTLTVTGSGQFTLKLRVPYWVQKGFTVQINGRTQSLDAEAGTYVSITRTWRSGDTIDISMPFTMRAERALDQPQTQALAYGPVPMVTLSTQKTYLERSFYAGLQLNGDVSRAMTPAGPMTFTANGLTVRPFYIDDTTAYHVYFHRVEPTIVFGTNDTGIPNVAREDGLTFLDVVWSSAPFKNHGQLVSTVEAATDAFAHAGLLTSSQITAIMQAAAHAHLLP
ncbi:hypothetical protein Raf01_49150 [Rugosimonospora africana]|uniref:LamG-like jellyroll fold domain-containing protein n=2 Tax=Rugosimonospora africana TaxID=556532 RepID=A0A8J3QTW0_9ACTN|nr:hypothetical protein Raf01_49150 [Rugosimonospora africana]